MARLALLLLLSLSACTQLLTEPPPVADSTMVEVLVELHLAEAMLASGTTPLPLSVRDSILQRHQLTESGYEEAVQYYTAHPEAYAALYEQVVNVLNEEQNRLLYQPDTLRRTPGETTNAVPTAP